MLFVCGGISLFGYFVLNLFGKKNLTVLYVNRLNSVQGSETAELFFLVSSIGPEQQYIALLLTLLIILFYSSLSSYLLSIIY